MVIKESKYWQNLLMIPTIKIGILKEKFLFFPKHLGLSNSPLYWQDPALYFTIHDVMRN